MAPSSRYNAQVVYSFASQISMARHEEQSFFFLCLNQ